MNADGTHKELVYEIERLLRDVSKEMRRKGREILVDFSITPPQFEALLLLQEHGDLTIGELSQKMYLAYSTTTDLVDRMERNELVERVRDQNDRRVVRLHMCEKGKELIEKVLFTRRDYIMKALSSVDKETLTLLKVSLQSLHDMIMK
ncbi:putative HTH-type transcriptional regulator YsmB [Collibacillus ludicampi]|uniref:HTH-type transcriptional regulator YsmB n=1 Tax=Collibacillus ludicampi TaxID=2771369 RepID=A0AAV4LAY6_9BACL|nr:MarR family transcriptional regulator [Collibacillus ludicampi]GIM44652.1 putative HTH-type transcriptional regulator YsmB [Collibacillus ludicampi]